MKKIFALTLVFVIASSLLAACGAQATERVLSSEEQGAVLAYADPMTDRFLAALAADDYATFIQDMDETMAKANTEAAYGKLRDLLNTKAGNYVSRQVKSVVELGDYYAVNYAVVYEKSPEVTMRIVFSKAEPHKIAGMWFNSPELQK